MSTKSLYVGNIPYSITSETLTNAFAAYGASNVRIMEGRGFAFVDIEADKLDSAIEDMNGKSVEGRNLSVNEARPRENHAGGSGGFFRSGDRSDSKSSTGHQGRGNRW